MSKILRVSLLLACAGSACAPTARSWCDPIELGAAVDQIQDAHGPITDRNSWCLGHPKGSPTGPALGIACCAESADGGGCGVDCSDPQFGPAVGYLVGTIDDNPEACCLYVRDGGVVAKFRAFD
jgi:hypothetical protein